MFIFGGVGAQCADMTAAGRDPLLFWLAHGDIELVFAGKRRGGVLIVGGMDKQDRARRDLTNHSQRAGVLYVLLRAALVNAKLSVCRPYMRA